MKLRLKVLIGILSVLIVANAAWVIIDIRKDIQINRELVQKELKVNDQIILDIYKNINQLNGKMDKIPANIQYAKIKLEKTLQQVNVMILNTTLGATGSGVTLKYKGKFYILTAGHMLDKEDDNLILSENSQKICELKVIKRDYSEIIGEGKGKDLMLLAPKTLTIQPRYYVELADMEPSVGTEVYIVGNPMTIEDVVSEGRVAMYTDDFMYIRDSIYFGNSGGGVYSLDGKLLGIVSHMQPMQPFVEIPPFIIDGIVRLNEIKEFLRSVI
jgi:hypothetical protein